MDHDEPRSEAADSAGEGLEQAKQAAKIAAVGAALGAAVGAASAIAGRDGGVRDEDGEREPDHEDSTDAEPQTHPPDAPESDDLERSPAAREEGVGPEPQEHPPAWQTAREDEFAPPERDAGSSEDLEREPPDATGRVEERAVSTDDPGGLVSRAREQLKALRGVEAESVSSLQHGLEGWTVTLEVLEVPRIPPSTDVLGSYEVVVDDDGELVRFERTGRYYRGQVARDGA